MLGVIASIKRCGRTCLALLVLFGCWSVTAQTFIVDTTKDTIDADISDGICADPDLRCSLRAAIQQANAYPDSDTITLRNEVYNLTIPGVDEDAAATGDLDILFDLTIEGSSQNQTIIDGAGRFRILHVRNGSALNLMNVTIRNGYHSNRGGGLYVDDDSNAVIQNTSFVGNKSHYGGGLYVSLRTNVTIKNSVFYNNSAVNGGAICSLDGVNDIKNVLKIINSTLTGNTAEYFAGALIIGDPQYAEIVNSTITLNKATMGVAGFLGGGNIYIRNSIIAGNLYSLRPDCYGSGFISQGYNIIGVVDGDSCNVIPMAGDQFGTITEPIDPLINYLADNGGPTPTQALMPDSPAIDAGNPLPPGSTGACERFDQRGADRLGRGVCDIGAFETTDGGDVWLNLVNSDDIAPGVALIEQVITVGNKGPNKASELILTIELPVGSENVNITGENWLCNANANRIICTRDTVNTQTQSSLVFSFVPPANTKEVITQASITTVSEDPLPDNNKLSLSTIINKAPVITIFNNTISYKNNTASAQIAPSVNIVDEDDTFLSAASIQFTHGYQPSEDTLYWSGNSDVFAQWLPEVATLELTGTDTIDHYEQALKEIIYENSASLSQNNSRGITITVSDAYLSSAPAQIIIEFIEKDASDKNDTSGGDIDNNSSIFDSEETGSSASIQNKANHDNNNNKTAEEITDLYLIWIMEEEKKKKARSGKNNSIGPGNTESILDSAAFKAYDKAWFNINNLLQKQNTLGSVIAIFSAGTIVLAGVVNIYMQALSVLSIFFSSPLLVQFDPVSITMMNTKERNRRRKEMASADKAETKKGITKLLGGDKNYEKN